MWTTLTFRDEDFQLGDELEATLAPDGAVFRGFLNVIERGYIILAGAGNQFGFPLESVRAIERI